MVYHGGFGTRFGTCSEDHYGKCQNNPKHCRVPLGYHLVFDGKVVLHGTSDPMLSNIGEIRFLKLIYQTVFYRILRFYFTIYVTMI
jgi:hypothetical protein